VPRMAYACLALLFATSFLPLRASAQDNSQDVAEAARQEKARKAAQSLSQTHVYTNEDLQRPRILTDSERAALAARKTAPASAPKLSPAIQSAEPSDATNASDAASAESLGEVARRYRQQKAAREAVQAQKGSTPAPYHLDIAQPALAAVAPRSSALASPVLAGANTANPAAGTLRRKRDPFSHFVRAPAVSPILPRLRAARPISVAPSNAPPHAAASSTFASSTVASPTIENLVSPAIRTLPVPSTNVSRRATKPLDAPDGNVTIRAGDSLWNLSRKYFGSGIRWQQWLASNPEVRNPRRIQPGMRLVVPQAPMLTHATPPSTLVIHSGDSLWKVAASQYGNGASWSCLVRANPSLRNPAIIFPGQRLLIPATCTAPRAPRAVVSNP
jgi:nucleoid-associated protein YgaU